MTNKPVSTEPPVVALTAESETETAYGDLTARELAGFLALVARIADGTVDARFADARDEVATREALDKLRFLLTVDVE